MFRMGGDMVIVGRGLVLSYLSIDHVVLSIDKSPPLNLSNVCQSFIILSAFSIRVFSSLD